MSVQSLQALEFANEIRVEGARIRRVMQDLPPDESRCCAAELLLDPPDAVARMRVGHFLSAIQRFGQKRAILYMHRAGLNGSSWDWKIGPMGWGKDGRHGLTSRQRRALAEALREGLL